MLICYHHNDLDGKAAAFVVHKFHPSSVTESTDSYVECEAGVDIFKSHTKSDDVVIVDLSISNNHFDRLVEVCNTARSVTWIDHHATSEDLVNAHVDELQKIENLTYFIDKTLCGAALAYVYFNIPYAYLKDTRATSEDEYYSISASYQYPPDVKVTLKRYNTKNKSDYKWFMHELKLPKWLYHVDDYDCWKKLDPDSNNFMLGTTAIDLDIVGYDRHLQRSCFKVTPFDILLSNDNTLNGYIKNGSIINDYITKRYDDEISDTFEWEFEDTKFLCKNSTGNSWNFRDKINEYDAVILFHYSGKSGKWKYSVYSSDKSKFDCKSFCEKFGGGGHLHAAGFETDRLIFTHKIENKKDNNSIAVKRCSNPRWIREIESRLDRKVSNKVSFHEIDDFNANRELVEKCKISLFILFSNENVDPYYIAEMINTSKYSTVYFIVYDEKASSLWTDDCMKSIDLVGRLIKDNGGIYYNCYYSYDNLKEKMQDIVIEDIATRISKEFS